MDLESDEHEEERIPDTSSTRPQNLSRWSVRVTIRHTKRDRCSLDHEPGHDLAAIGAEREASAGHIRRPRAQSAVRSSVCSWSMLRSSRNGDIARREAEERSRRSPANEEEHDHAAGRDLTAGRHDTEHRREDHDSTPSFREGD